MSVVPASEQEAKFADRISATWGFTGSADKGMCRYSDTKVGSLDAALKSLNFDISRPEKALYGHGATVTPGRKESCWHGLGQKIIYCFFRKKLMLCSFSVQRLLPQRLKDALFRF